MYSDYIRFEWAVSDDLCAKLTNFASAVIASDRIMIELCDSETHIICESWRLRGDGLRPQKVHSDALELIRQRSPQRLCSTYTIVVEMVGDRKRHWMHWLPPVGATQSDQRFTALRNKLTVNHRTVLDCAARTLTDALLRVDERVLMHMRAYEDEDGETEQNDGASFYVLFPEPVPLSIMPLLLAMAPLKCVGRLPCNPHIFYAMTALGCAIEVTSYGVGDALPLCVTEDFFGVFDVSDSTVVAFDAPFDIDGGKRPFRDIFNQIVYF